MPSRNGPLESAFVLPREKGYVSGMVPAFAGEESGPNQKAKSRLNRAAVLRADRLPNRVARRSARIARL